MALDGITIGDTTKISPPKTSGALSGITMKNQSQVPTVESAVASIKPPVVTPASNTSFLGKIETGLKSFWDNFTAGPKPKPEEPVLKGTIITGPSYEDVSKQAKDLTVKAKTIDHTDPLAINEYNSQVEDLNKNLDQYHLAQKAHETITKDVIPVGQTIKFPLIKTGMYVANDPGNSIIKSLVEFPEKSARSLTELVGLSKQNSETRSNQYAVPSYAEVAGKTTEELINQGIPPAAAVILSSASTAGEFANDALMYYDPLKDVLKSTALENALTKQTVEKIIPGTQKYFNTAQVKDIWQTDKLLTAEEKADVITTIGGSKENLKNAIKNGISIGVPEQKIVTLEDKPYWSKIKGYFGIEPSTPKLVSSSVRIPVQTVRGYLSGATEGIGKESIEAIANEIKNPPQSKSIPEVKSAVEDIASQFKPKEEPMFNKMEKGAPIQKEPAVNLKRDITIRNLAGDKITIKSGEAFSPQIRPDQKVVLKPDLIVSKSTYETIKQNSKVAEAPKPFAPELTQTEEIIKGEVGREGADEALKNKGYKMTTDMDGSISIEHNGEEIEYNDLPKSIKQLIDMGSIANPTKFSKYQLPGGRDYHEILIQVPEDRASQEEVSKWTKQFSDELKNANIKQDDVEGIAVFVENHPEWKSKFEEIKDIKRRLADESKNSFTSSHWEEKNVLAHVRGKKYNDPKYGQVYFMEEMQSDWAREARAKGIENLEAQKEFNTYHSELRKKYAGVEGINELPTFYKIITPEEKLKFDELQQLAKGSIPDHPLLKNWQEVAIKTALIKAVNSGADYFAWTNGAQQQARYHLSKEVKSVYWDPFNNGKQIELDLNDGRKMQIFIDETGKISDSIKGLNMPSQWEGKQLADVIGKGLAEKISEKDTGELAGEGLNVGGEWASNLYDKQIPSIVKNLTGEKPEVIDMGLSLDNKKTSWYTTEKSGDYRGGSVIKGELTPENIKVGELVKNSSGDYFIITDSLGDGEFKAVPKDQLHLENTVGTSLIADGTYKPIMIGNQKYFTSRNEFTPKEFNISTQKSSGQQAIKLTPEVKAIVKGESAPLSGNGTPSFNQAIHRPALPEMLFRPQRVMEYKNRLKLNGADPVLVDAIVTPTGERAWGLSYAGTLSFEKIVQKFTEDHEIFHQVWKARKEMSIFKDFDWKALDDEALALYGKVPEGANMTQEQWQEEELAKDMQRYQQEREQNKATSFFGKIREFFDRLLASLKRLFNNPKDIREFYRVMSEGKADQETNIMNTAPPSFNKQQQGGYIDFFGDAKKADTSGELMQAPNGEKSSLTKEQYKTVRTPEFKNWFGDWENDPANASKIVDKNGEPLVVYHGTNNNFTSFDENRIGARDSGWFGKGFYFSLSEGEAGYYGKNNIGAFLNLKTPFDFSKFYKGIEEYKGYGYTDTYYLSKISDEIKDLENNISGRIFGKGDETTDFKRIGKEINLKEYKENVAKENMTSEPVYFKDRNGDNKISYQYDDIYGREQWLDTNEKTPIPPELLKYILYDKKWNTNFDTNSLYGVERKLAEYTKFTEKLKELGYDGTMQSPEGDEYVAFKANQIKSSSNNKTFGESNDINFNRQETQTIEQLQNQRQRYEQSLEAYKENPQAHMEAYGEDRSQIYKDKIAEINQRIKDLKNVAINTGDKLADVRTILANAEERVGLTEPEVEKANQELNNEIFKQNQEINNEAIDLFKTKEDAIEFKAEVNQEREYNKVMKEALDQSRGKELSKYAYQGELGEVGGGPGITGRWANRGDQIAMDLGFPDSETAREAYDKYRADKKEFIANKKDLNKKVRDFNNKKSLLDFVEKKLRKEGRDRNSKIRDIQEFFYLTDKEMKDVRGNNKDFRLMTEPEFANYLKGVQGKALEAAEHRDAVLEVEHTIFEKELRKVDNLRLALKMRELKNMSLKELDQFNNLLQTYQKGDEFLGKRQIQTAKLTDLGEIRTHREAKEILAKEAGVPIEALNSIEVKDIDRFLYDVAFARQNPLYKVMVDNVNRAEVEAGRRFYEIKEETDRLVKLARQSRKRSFLDKLVPTDQIIFDYLSADSETKLELVKRMTVEEINASLFIQKQYALIRDYLVEQGTLEKYRANYITHVRRSFLEALKETGKGIFSKEGLKKILGEVFDTNKLQRANFNILNDKTGDVLPLEKFFKFSMERTGNLVPSKNVAKAFTEYLRTFEKKRQLDSFIPKIDIFAHVLTPQATTKGGLLKNDTLVVFIKKWLNTKKGRVVDLGFVSPGDKVDLALRSGVALTRFLDLALNIPVGLASNLGAQVSTFSSLGTKKYALGQFRARTKQGKNIIEQNKSLLGENFMELMRDASKDVGDKTNEILFGLYHIADKAAKNVFLLGELTPEEFKTGKISTERLAYLRNEMGKWHIMEGMDSIVGKTAVGKVFTQYKSWAVPLLHTNSNNIKTFINLVKDKENPFHAKETKELFRTIVLTSLILILGYKTYQSLSNKKNRTFLENLAYKSMNDALSLIGALNPTFWTTPTRLQQFVSDLGTSLTNISISLATGDRTAEGKITDLKKLESTITPSLFRGVIKDTTVDINESLNKSANLAESKLNKMDESIITPAQDAWNEVKKVGVGTDEGQEIIDNLDEPVYQAYRQIKASDLEYWTNLSNKVTPLVKKVHDLGFGKTDEGQEIVDSLSSDEYNMYAKIKKLTYGLDTEGVQSDEEVAVQQEAEKTFGTSGDSTWDKQSFIDHIVNIAKGVSQDPVDAFNAIFTGDWRITGLKNGQVIVNRMSEEESQAIKESLGGKNVEWKLDHIVPLTGGGLNTRDSRSNLQLIKTEDWQINTPVEVFIGKALGSGKISGKQAREYIIRFKAGQGQPLSSEIKKEYADKYNGEPITFDQIKQEIVK